MKKFACVALLFLLAASTVQPQAPAKIITYPKVPAKETLDRMGLAVQWKAQLFIQGTRDGLASVQAIPFKDTVQVVVQSYSGVVALHDGDTGDLLWKTQVGVPYWSSLPAGYDSEAIFVTRRNMLHILNRVTGAPNGPHPFS